MSFVSNPTGQEDLQVLQSQTRQIEILHELFETQVDRASNATAVIWGQQELTYGDLDCAANRLARHLRAMGIGRGAVVAMLLSRSLDPYVALLGILKSGAAYVPIDPEYPSDRIGYILQNSGAEALITTANLALQISGFDGAVIRMDVDRDALDAHSPARLIHAEVGVNSGDPCYIIYTSGSTGRPKGVIVEHRNVSRLVRAEGAIYDARPEDRVYQGASLAFDLSVEEIWIAFHAGATLVAATPEMMRAGPDLSRILARHGVTILSCVPTLLAMLGEDIPSLRLLILGGEACPGGLVKRWARPGLRILNTYGPTETTVIATYAELSPDSPVTIGRAVPGYHIYLLDEDLKPVPHGEVGEICIGGAGVARGYVGLPEHTRERFVPDPVGLLDDPDSRIYRSGDLGRINDAGDLEFMGRADTQVKLRGFRIELDEIESVMVQADSGILAAACTIWHDPTTDARQLVGYIVPRGGSHPDPGHVRTYSRSRLPSYMVPAVIETLAELPLLPSGKLNRSALPPPRQGESEQGFSPQRALTSTEQCIAKVWKTVLGVPSVSPDDDFFDFGGDSLRVALLVSELRVLPRFSSVSVADVYDHPTIASLAATIDASGQQTHHRRPPASSVNAPREQEATERRRHFIAGICQSAALYFMFGLSAAEWTTPYLLYLFLIQSGHSMIESAGWAAASAAAVFPTFLLVALAAKWLLLGRVRPGRHPLWGWYYLRWWFVQNVVSMVPFDYLGGTPLLPVVYRLFGVKVGRDVYLATDRLAAFDLVSIGDGASVNEDASLLGFSVENGELIIGAICIGSRCYVGGRTVLGLGSVMQDGARLEDMSLLPAAVCVPAGETWAGSPARRVSDLATSIPPAPSYGAVRRFATSALYAALTLSFPIILLAAILPGMILLLRIDLFIHPLRYFAAAPLVGASFVLLLMIEVLLFKWLLVGRVRPGIYRVDGAFYIRHWILDQLRALSLDLLGPLHATLYLAPWYRALGARLGRFVELSTATSTSPDLLEIGDGGTVADDSSLGTPHIEGGWMSMMPTRLGRRAFVGNSAMLPAGVELGEGSLIGVLSIAPAGPDQAARSHCSWLGSPPILLPRRQPSTGFIEERTFAPPRKLRIARAVFELLRITLPPAGFIIVAAIVIESTLRLLPLLGLSAALLVLPIIYGASCLAVLLAVALAKWSLIGRFRSFVRPLWSNFVWRLELQNALFEFLATPLALEFLTGTPFLSWYLRLLGARIGSRVYVGTTGFLEFDLIHIGDRTALNKDCILQTHLFEDRILKAAELHVGADCKVGADSVVLYDSKMEDGACLEDLSLLMKGETLLAQTTWMGIPAQRAVGVNSNLDANSQQPCR